METTSIGLDIGSSAARAAEITTGRDGQVLRRYAQVGLPPGAVTDGEIINGPAVSEALRRLWSEAGFSSSKVVLGVSGHRVVIRQADVPALDEEDLRSALRFDAQELIPIPMESASFDFRVLDRGQTDPDGKTTMRILIVAGHREMLRGHLSALKDAGLTAAAIDASPLALMRVVPPSGPGPDHGGGAEAIVSIGAELTTVAVRENGVPRFIRTLAVGGAKLTKGLASAMHVDASVAERLKRSADNGGGRQTVQSDRALVTELRDLAEEVRATVDFFAAQADGATITRLLVTGGASQTQGLVEMLAGNSTTEIQRVDPFAGLRVGDLGLNATDLERARSSAATAVGLALWPTDDPDSRLSILPEDVAVARRNRRLTALAGVGVAGLAGLLGVTGAVQYLAVHNARDQVHSAQNQVATLQGQVSVLESKTAVHEEAGARQAMVVRSLTGDIDWVSLLSQLYHLMPPGVALSSFTGVRSTATTTSTSSSSSANPGVGTLQFTVTGPGGLPTVAAWLEGLQKDHALQGAWVQGISVNSSGGAVTFTSTANLTTNAQSDRAKAVKS